jgi:hypothetical protein
MEKRDSQDDSNWKVKSSSLTRCLAPIPTRIAITTRVDFYEALILFFAMHIRFNQLDILAWVVFHFVSTSFQLCLPNSVFHLTILLLFLPGAIFPDRGPSLLNVSLVFPLTLPFHLLWPLFMRGPSSFPVSFISSLIPFHLNFLSS